MYELSKAYRETCNCGNAINRVIEASENQPSVKLAAEDLREQIVQLTQLIATVAEFEQAEKFRVERVA